MSRIGDVINALLTVCEGLQIGSPALPVALPEHPGGFNPPADGKYLDCRVFPNRPAWESVSGGALEQGLLQISVVWPKGQGVVAPGRTAGLVVEVFPLGMLFPSEGVTVKVARKPTAMSPLSETGELRIPVTIPWTASEVRL